MTAYEQLMALKGNQPKADAENNSGGIHTFVANSVQTMSHTGERVITAVRFVPEVWAAGRLSVREQVAQDILAIINR